MLNQGSRVENLSTALGRGIGSRNRVWNWVAELHRLVGRYDNPMPTCFLAPIAGLKVTDTGFESRLELGIRIRIRARSFFCNQVKKLDPTFLKSYPHNKPQKQRKLYLLNVCL